MAKSSLKKKFSKPSERPDDKKSPTKFDPQPVKNADVALHQLFIRELKGAFWAENHLVKALPKIIAAAGAAELKKALSNHLKETRTHVARLEKTFELLGEKVIAKKCDAMEGLTMSGEQVIENTIAGTPTRDTGIIMSGLKVESFEITTYEGLIKLANASNKPAVGSLLQQNLDEEIKASEILLKIS